MKQILKKIQLLLFAVTVFTANALAQQYKYETVPNDPMGVRIYTLDNGLKVLMSVTKDEPRIQTFVAVRVGSKNDPKETTGLAHYFEHMMFKGTPDFGTLNWEKEKVMINTIEQLFEVYRNETDSLKRAAIYHKIDSISFEASKLAIPNEYDKLMSAIGSTGTNAATSNDYTIYIENIPSNQLENWAMIQANRFSHPVLRLFHTELETVYEEKNMSLTNDARKAGEALLRGLFPNHPYGQQTTLGEAEHLKNPSMKNIREFFDKYYVPNNMAVILAGDFNPDEAIKIVDKYFGTLKAKPLPEFSIVPEEPIIQPKEYEVVGLEAENVSIGFRFAGATSADADMLSLINSILYNTKAGLIDLNINKKQLALRAYASARVMTDYSILQLGGRNKKGQSLDEVKDLLLKQVELLKKGEFPDWMLEAAINNYKLNRMKALESASSRARLMMNAFLNGIEWENVVNSIERLQKISKDDVVKFANDYLGDNYVVVYKRQGKPQDVAKVAKPPITPIHINRDVESDFLKKVKETKVTPVEPVFIDYNKDITKIKLNKNIEVLYKQNTENGTFNLVYYYPFGSLSNPALTHAADYIQLLGTSKLSAEEVSQEFYRLACTFNINVNDEDTYITLSGLSENAVKALNLMEAILNDCQPDESALKAYIANQIKARNDAKRNQSAVFRALVSYATYGDSNPQKFILSEKELSELKANDLIGIIKSFSSYPHTILYYGPLASNDLKDMLSKEHRLPKKFIPTPENKRFEPLETTSDRVLFAHYDAKQSYLQTLSRGQKYDDNLYPIITLYNEYFGGGMNAIVFQEMREKRGLAYTARSRYTIPSKPDDYFINMSYIATQNDKVVDAFNAFNELFNAMPENTIGFNLSKEALISDIRNNRIRNMRVLYSYLNAKRMGWNEDIRKKLYSQIPTYTFDDVKKFQEQFVKGKPKTYIILGKEADMNFQELEKLYGPVTKVTLEQIFGY